MCSDDPHEKRAVLFDELENVEEAYCHDGEPFTGIARLFGPDGKLREEAGFKQGLEHGRFREWDKYQNLVREGYTRNGVYHGAMRSWFRSGSLRREEHYEYGVRMSMKRWDRHGNLEEEESISQDNSALRFVQRMRSFD